MGNSPSILRSPREFVELENVLDFDRLKRHIDQYVSTSKNGTKKDLARVSRDFTRYLYLVNKSYLEYSLNSDELFILLQKVGFDQKICTRKLFFYTCDPVEVVLKKTVF